MIQLIVFSKIKDSDLTKQMSLQSSRDYLLNPTMNVQCYKIIAEYIFDNLRHTTQLYLKSSERPTLTESYQIVLCLLLTLIPSTRLERKIKFAVFHFTNAMHFMCKQSEF